MKRPHRRPYFLTWVIIGPVPLNLAAYFLMQPPDTPYGSLPSYLVAPDQVTV